METELPANWKGPTLDRYDGSIDTNKHIDIYVTQIGLYTSDDNIFCRVFPTYLKGVALSWFTRSPTKFMDYFDTLVTKFEAQFATSKPHHLALINLFDIR